MTDMTHHLTCRSFLSCHLQCSEPHDDLVILLGPGASLFGHSVGSPLLLQRMAKYHGADQDMGLPQELAGPPVCGRFEGVSAEVRREGAQEEEEEA